MDTWFASTYHLAVLSNAAENMDVQIVSESLFSIILGIYSKMELLDPVIILFFKICLFLAVLGLCCCGEWGLLSSFGAQACHCGGFSGCREWALGLTQAQQLWLPGSIAQA